MNPYHQSPTESSIDTFTLKGNLLSQGMNHSIEARVGVVGPLYTLKEEGTNNLFIHTTPIQPHAYHPR